MEARRREAATSEILKVISQSKFDLQRVLDTLIETAARLCDADIGVLRRRIGDVYELAAGYGLKPEWRDALARLVPNTPGHHSVVGRAMLEMRTVQTPDCLGDPELLTNPQLAQCQKLIGYRAILVTPLQRDGESIGAIALYKLTPGQFSPREISLIETFADQAVIAIENARLFEAEHTRTRELQESLEYQTATSDVLNVISRSRFDLQPLLNSIVATAARLCEADSAQIFRPSEASYQLAASYGYSTEFKEYVNKLRLAPGRGSVTGRVLLKGKAVQIPDVLADSEYTIMEAQRLGGFRSHLGVPLLREGSPIGVIVVSRRRAQPFNNKHIELVTTFADQAVIAIENTRLFEAERTRTSELAEALEQQAATSEVLQVISGSPGELEPVFAAMLENAVRICGASFGNVAV